MKNNYVLGINGICGGSGTSTLIAILNYFWTDTTLKIAVLDEDKVSCAIHGNMFPEKKDNVYNDISLLDQKRCFDFILVDNPTENTFMHLDGVLTCLNPNSISLKLLPAYIAEIEMHKKMHPQVQFLGFIPNFVDKKKKWQYQIWRNIEKRYESYFIKLQLPYEVNIGKFIYDNNHSATKSYLQKFAKGLLRKIYLEVQDGN